MLHLSHNDIILDSNRSRINALFGQEKVRKKLEKNKVVVYSVTTRYFHLMIVKRRSVGIQLLWR